MVPVTFSYLNDCNIFSSFLLEILHKCLSVTVMSGRDKIQSVISLPLLARVNKQMYISFSS